MDERILLGHKRQPKRLSLRPSFKPLKRRQLPKPLHQVGGPRIQATGLIELGGEYSACFLWRDGSLLADAAFYGWLFVGKPGNLLPLASLHYHPSHNPSIC